jgi:hypothetical protein
MHSDKEGTRPTDKHGDGFTPLLATVDATEGPLAIPWRPGNAGSGTAAEPIHILDVALAPRPVDPATQPVLGRTDSADCSHAFLEADDARGVRFLIGHPLPEDLAATVIGRRRLRWVPPSRRREPRNETSAKSSR